MIANPVRRLTTAAALSLLAATPVAVPLSTASAAPARPAAAVSAAPDHDATTSVAGVTLLNSFVSAVGWVQPGQDYPSRVILTNTTAAPVVGLGVTVDAPRGTSFTGTTAVSGVASHSADQVTWTVPTLAPGAQTTLVIEQLAETLAQEPTLVWRDLSTTATLTVAGASSSVDSHGPKVIPPGEQYETARYGDRPFPVVPVAYTDRDYSAHEQDLDTVINDPAFDGSTFNLYQEMSLGQLFPHGTVPSVGIASADFDYEPGFDFRGILDAPQGSTTTCTGLTFADSPIPVEGTPLYPERISDGVYQLPGTTGYYGSDGNGSAVVGSLTGQAALMQIDNGCGPTSKIVWDAAAIADPEIDYSDYDTDKDGVVDFFMAVFAGCGGNGASQLTLPGDPLDACPLGGTVPVSYDNVWPHSSSLEFYYTDPETGLPGFTTDDQLKNLEGQPLFWTDDTYKTKTTDPASGLKVFVRVGPYNLNPETAIDSASVISHEYGHSLGLPDFYSLGDRETYGDWTLMATDKSHHIDAFGRQELGWVVPQVLDGNRSVTGFQNSKQDTDSIVWQAPDGSTYTLDEGSDGRVQNSEMYVAKLPGRQLIDPAKFSSGDGASATHAWFSTAGNDFGCASDGGGRNLDFAIPAARDLPAGSTISLELKSMWDIEWDYDYGFVLTPDAAGSGYVSHPSANGFTTSLTDPLAGNPNQNGCLAAYDNGITGTSGSYAAGSEATDRKLGNTPEMVFLADKYDVSDIVGDTSPSVRLSYSTDPGLSRPGWFIDDLKVTATLPGGGTQELLVTDFEASGGPEDPFVFNGGCQGDNPGGACTKGWTYVEAGAGSPADHAYYLEMRDRSGFDLDGRGQADRGGPEFEPGLYVAYTDESHGYGNVGTDNPPAQSPLDSQPEPGSDTPNLNDAAWTAVAGDSSFSDGGSGRVDNYSDPSRTAPVNGVTNPWLFDFDCLGFDVTSMTGNTGNTLVGDLTGDVAFTMGAGCGEFDFGYGDVPPPPANTAPTASATATPASATTKTVVTLDASGSTDTETPALLDYSWDFGNGGTTKDAAGAVTTHTFPTAGTYPATVTVTDPEGLVDTAEVVVTVTKAPNVKPKAQLTTSSTQPLNTRQVTLSGKGSSDPETPAEDLVYSWNFGDGGSTVDATGFRVVTRFAKAGPRTITLTVTDADGASSSASRAFTVRREIGCGNSAVTRSGSWRTVRSSSAPGGGYCDNLGSGSGADVLKVPFSGPQVDVFHGRSTRGGAADVYVDGRKIGTVSFRSSDASPALRYHRLFTGLGSGRHVLRLVVTSRRAYLDGFIVTR